MSGIAIFEKVCPDIIKWVVGENRGENNVDLTDAEEVVSLTEVPEGVVNDGTWADTLLTFGDKEIARITLILSRVTTRGRR